jgi:multimeric flavodoxin WrbA
MIVWKNAPKKIEENGLETEIISLRKMKIHPVRCASNAAKHTSARLMKGRMGSLRKSRS